MRFTRDSVMWTALFLTAMAVFLSGHFELMTKAFPSIGLVWQARIELLAAVGGFVAGYMKMSPLALSYNSRLAGTADPDRTLNPLNAITKGTGS